MLCTKELSAPPYIALRECMMSFMMSPLISQDQAMKGFPTNHTRLEIPHRSIMHHSSCDILPLFPCHVPMTVVAHCQTDGTTYYKQ